MRTLNLIIALLTLAALGACAPKKKPFDPNKERKFFSVAVRQLPPEPVYNRLAVAYLPEPLPSRSIVPASHTRLSPIFQFEMKNATLEQTARILANMSRYTSYCSSVIANRKINIIAVGTIDEIAEFIAAKAGINVSIDHANREVRFLANGSTGSRGVPRSTKSYPAPRKAIEGLPGDVKVSEKTNGYLNNIKIEG